MKNLFCCFLEQIQLIFNYQHCLKGQHFIHYGGNKKRENTT